MDSVSVALDKVFTLRGQRSISYRELVSAVQRRSYDWHERQLWDLLGWGYRVYLKKDEYWVDVRLKVAVSTWEGLKESIEKYMAYKMNTWQQERKIMKLETLCGDEQVKCYFEQVDELCFGGQMDVCDGKKIARKFPRGVYVRDVLGLGVHADHVVYFTRTPTTYETYMEEGMTLVILQACRRFVSGKSIFKRNGRYNQNKPFIFLGGERWAGSEDCDYQFMTEPHTLEDLKTGVTQYDYSGALSMLVKKKVCCN